MWERGASWGLEMGGKDLTKKMNGPYFGIPKKYDLKIGLKFMWNEPKNFKLK